MSRIVILAVFFHCPVKAYTDWCQIGVTIKGLGFFDGDYNYDWTNSYRNINGGFNWNPLIKFVKQAPSSCPGGHVDTPAGWGLKDPKAAAIAMGNWVIAGGTNGSWAVCRRGCPDLPGMCGIPGSATSRNFNPSIWPASMPVENMEWEVFEPAARGDGPAGGTLVNASGQCCKEKPQECKACQPTTCSKFKDFGSCTAGTDKVSKDCCVWESGPPPPRGHPPYGFCACRGLGPPVCDHDGAVLV